eukprot:m.43674 g.43674  ORF g.43674 m.43674 type:complete len:315 (+) comp6437_c1_seq2:399-1343(+)
MPRDTNATDVVWKAVTSLGSSTATWLPTSPSDINAWVAATWSPDGLPQVVVFTLAYFVLVGGLICIVEANPLFKPSSKQIGAAHNLAMSIFSAWMLVGGTMQFWSNWNQFGGYSNSLTWCDPNRKLFTGMEQYYYYFFVSKFLEYFDSVLLIVNRKYSLSIGFSLQVYHHSTTASIAWVAFWGGVPSSYIGLLSNCLVHVVMYLYFALVSMDRRLRRYGHWVTKLQLAQFWLAFGCSMYWFAYYNDHCGSTAGKYVVIMYISYLVFFLIFNQARHAAMRRSQDTPPGGSPSKAPLSGFVPPCVQTHDEPDKKHR